MTSVSTYSGEVSILRRHPRPNGGNPSTPRVAYADRSVAEAGWYNDEHDPARARWFDGRAWTDHTILKEEWVGLGQPPSPEGELPLRAYRPIADPRPFPMTQGSWIVLSAAVLAIVVILVVVTRA
jgi:hypothetical protein